MVQERRGAATLSTDFEIQNVHVLASAAAGAQREVLGLRGVVHVVGGPDVLHGRVLAALLRPKACSLASCPALQHTPLKAISEEG